MNQSVTEYPPADTVAPQVRSRGAAVELTVVIPTYNERDNIVPLLANLESALVGRRWEAVFVDDDSPDGTADLVRAIASENPQIRCIHRIGRRGLSRAVIEGVLSSSARFVAVMDADLQHDERILPAMLRALETEPLDIVVGSRYCSGGSIGAWDGSRAAMSSFATRLAKAVVRVELTDPMSGFFVMRREAFMGAARRLSGEGYKILLDIFASSPGRLKFKEHPYTFRDRIAGSSKLDSAVVWQYLLLLADKKFGHIVPPRFVMFAMVGGSGLLVHFAVLWAAHRLGDVSFPVAQTLATFVAMTSNYARQQRADVSRPTPDGGAVLHRPRDLLPDLRRGRRGQRRHRGLRFRQSVRLVAGRRGGRRHRGGLELRGDFGVHVGRGQPEKRRAVTALWRHAAFRWYLGLALLYFGAWVVMLPRALTGVTIFDEGFMVTGAVMALEGQLPYRDFISTYGPAQYYLLALLFGIFGQDLLVSRLAHLSVVAALPVVAFILASALGGRYWRGPLGAAMVVAVLSIKYWPIPSYPVIAALLFLMMASAPLLKTSGGVSSRDLRVCSLLIGIAGLFRWDFGVFGFAALGVAVVLFWLHSSNPRATALNAAMQAIWPGVAIMALVYLPLLLIGDLERWYREIFDYLRREFPSQRDILFMTPAYFELVDAVEARDYLGMWRSAFLLVFAALPAVVCTTTLVTLAVGYWRRQTLSKVELAALYLALLGLMLMNQMRVRPSVWQGYPAFIASVPLMVHLAHRGGSRILAGRSRVRDGISIAALTILIAASAAWFFRSSQTYWSGQLVPLADERATGIRVTADLVYYRDLVNFVKTRTQPGAEIYSGPLSHRRVFANDAIIYFLADRAPATRFVETNTGLISTAAAQHELMSELDHRRVPLIVLIDIASKEPNLSSVDQGPALLDPYIRARYRATARFGPYTVMERR